MRQPPGNDSRCQPPRQHDSRACRRWLATAIFLLVGTFGIGVPADSGIVDGPQPLFKASTFPAGWSPWSADNGTKLSDVWRVQKGAGGTDDVLICIGKPHGYLRTRKQYGDFEFRLEWMYPKDANGNSGVLIHTGKDDKIWPDSIQVQLHGPTAGSIFPSGSAKTDNKLTVRDLSRPPGQWNTCVITSQAGRLTVVINGKKAGEVTGSQPSQGSIALQSEGSEVHFRRVMLKVLKP